MTMTRRITAALASSRGLFITALLAGALCGMGFLGIGENDHIVTARFANANGLVVGNEVRVAGVQAGTVKSVQIGLDPSTGAQYAQVDLQIDPSQWPLHQGTFIAVKPKGVLSNVFIELDPGSVHNPSLGTHPFFDVNQTQSPVNLDALQDIFTPDVRNSIRTQLQEGVIAFGNGGANNLNDTIHYANPLTLDAIPVTDVLATRSPQLDALNFEFDKISGDIAREDANLRPLIINLDTLLNALAVRQVELQGTLVHAANTFSSLDQAFKDPTVQQSLEHFFANGPQALRCATAMPEYLNPLIAAVNPYIRYNGVQSLDFLLAEFVTATGYNNGTSGGVDSLRVDPTLPPNGYSAQPSGGLTANHHGYHNYGNYYEEQPPIPVTADPTLAGCPPLGGQG
jgi:phospholipid/cholesterol/gamma-HCH transport system substrate-binding protein